MPCRRRTLVLSPPRARERLFPEQEEEDVEDVEEKNRSRDRARLGEAGREKGGERVNVTDRTFLGLPSLAAEGQSGLLQ